MKKFLLINILAIFLSAEDYDTINNAKIPISKKEPIEKFSKGKYISPTELEPGFIIESLQEPTINGLLVSVGTFRTLITFAWALNITHLLMLDIDPKTIEFNKAHLNLIKCINKKYAGNEWQRLQYITHMYGFALLDIVKEMFSRQSKQNVGLISDYINNHSEYITNEINDNCLNIINESNLLKTIITKNLDDIMLDKFLSYNRVNDEKFYWEDDKQWDKIKTALDNSQIAMTRLNIADEDDLKLLANFIFETQLNLGLFDMSNILQYISDAKAWINNISNANLQIQNILLTQKPGLWKAYNDNIFEKLSSFKQPKIIEKDWYYYLVPFSILKDVLVH